MIANNFFTALGEFFTNVLFIPFDKMRSLDSWWVSNSVNFLLVFVGFIAFGYWMVQMKKHENGAKVKV